MRKNNRIINQAKIAKKEADAKQLEQRYNDLHQGYNNWLAKNNEQELKEKKEREKNRDKRQAEQKSTLSPELVTKLKQLSQDRRKYKDSIENNTELRALHPNKEVYIYHPPESTEYEKDLADIDYIDHSYAVFQEHYKTTLDNAYKSQYKEDSNKIKMNHFLVIFIIIGIIVLIVTHIKDISDYWLFLFVPIILIVGYISYTWFKRILEKKYTEKQNKREQTLKNITNIYDDTIKNKFINNEEDTISTIINNTKKTIGT